MDRLNQLLSAQSNLLSIYLTAGFPTPSATLTLCKALQDAGVDLLEIGFPFSDPLADGPVIQRSSEQALRGGMNLQRLFGELTALRSSITIPVLLMGYINPVLQYGMDRFVADCRRCGVDGVILPDLPREEFSLRYTRLFTDAGLHFISLISPSTSEERIRQIDESSTAFIYAVSSASITGNTLKFDAERESYFKRLADMKLRHPILVGFGISNQETFNNACKYHRGAIVGSAFISALERGGTDYLSVIKPFIASLRGNR